MRVPVLDPAVRVYLEALISAAAQGVGDPAPPATPGDPESAAFLRAVLAPLAEAVQAAATMRATYESYGPVREALQVQHVVEVTGGMVALPTGEMTAQVTLATVAAAAEAGDPVAQAIFEQMWAQQMSSGAP